MDHPYLPYIIMEGYCFLYTVSILFRINNNLGSQHEVRGLKAMIYSFFVLLFFDILSYLVEDHMMPSPVWLNSIFNFLSVVAISFGCYFWFRFVEARLNPHFPNQRLADLLFLIPLVTIVICDIVSLFNGWMFWVTSENVFEENMYFVWIQGSVNYFYLVLPTGYSIYRAIRTRSRLERAEYWIYAAYMIAPLLSGILEEYIPTVPILALSIFLIINIIFLMIQNMQIYNDSLTDLNNRRHLNEYMEERLPKVSENKPLALYMIDLNGLKYINDHFGHVEGDNSLRLIADVLKNAAVDYGAFAARYGGDEFTFVVPDLKKSPQEVAAYLKKQLADCQSKIDPSLHKFDVTMSIGFGITTSPSCSQDQLVEAADEMLYSEKQEWHRQNDAKNASEPKTL